MSVTTPLYGHSSICARSSESGRRGRVLQPHQVVRMGVGFPRENGSAQINEVFDLG
jgi:hypothetical protein